MVNMEKATENKLPQIPLSNNNIFISIIDISDDILPQVVTYLIWSPSKIELPTRRDHGPFQSKTACCIRTLREWRHDKNIFFYLLSSYINN